MRCKMRQIVTEPEHRQDNPEKPESTLCAGGCKKMVLLGSENHLCDRCLDDLFQQQPSWRK